MKRLLSFLPFALLLFQRVVNCALKPIKTLPLQRHRCSPLRTFRYIGTVGSNVLADALVLQQKKVLRRDVNRSPPREVAKVWDEFQDVLLRYCDNNKKPKFPNIQKVLEDLKVPLKAQFARETDFDFALFKAFQGCLGTAAFELTGEPNIIFLSVGSNKDYAVGIARQQTPAVNLQGENLQRDVVASAFTTTGMSFQFIPNHAVCLFQRRNNKWFATDCFSVVELKLSSTICEEFEVDENQVTRVDLLNRHSALAQVVVYNMGCVLLYHAKRGVLSDHLPLAIIAGKSKKDKNLLSLFIRNGQSKQNRLRWVSGRFEIPTACGDGFVFSVQDFGLFEEGENDDKSMEMALSIYLDTILFGLSLALSVHSRIVQGKPPQTVPASGQSLMIGNVKLAKLKLRASPIAGAEVASNEKEIWSITQGDLFAGKLNVYTVLQQPNALLVSFLVANKLRKETDVLVKVSSSTVHSLLLEPKATFAVLKEIRQANSELVNEISTVLYGAVKMKSGLVTIMADLSKQGYQTLKPKDFTGELSDLWDGFQKLVNMVLLPLAELGIIHPDIRPGYDETSNVLYKVEESRARTAVALKLIDYDSLVLVEDWAAPEPDGRYFRKDADWDATTFVWWQCVVLAYAWKEKLNASTLQNSNYLHSMMQRLRFNHDGPEWWMKFHESAQSCTISADCVRLTLTKLAKELVSEDD